MSVMLLSGFIFADLIVLILYCSSIWYDVWCCCLSILMVSQTLCSYSSVNIHASLLSNYLSAENTRFVS